jgi:simple sugar transport system ATP-binding protein
VNDILISIEGISKNFGGVRALDQVDLTIRKGEIHCLMGENGSGKSTLIKIISGVYKPDKGKVVINNVPFVSLKPTESIAQGIQIIYQDFSVFPNLTVAENIYFGYAISSGQKLTHTKENTKKVKRIIEEVGLKAGLNELVENLSVADKQLIAICRALLNDAKLLVLDEPTTALTKKEVDILFSIIKRLQSQGVSILFVSHKLDEAFELAERFTILRNGRKIITTETADITREQFIDYMTGRTIQNTQFHTMTNRSGTPLLEAKNLSLSGAFKDVSLKLFEGEILGITGLLGSGRTELALSLFGIAKVETGQILIGGKQVVINSVEDAIKLNIAYVPEDRLTEGLFLPQSVIYNTSIADIKEFEGGMKRLDCMAMEQLTRDYVKQLSIATDNIYNPVQALSGGNQQKVVIAKWLACHPKIIIFNGPTVGVDIAVKYDIHNKLRELSRQNIGIILISDDIPEVHANCNRILVMKNGRIIHELGNTETSEQELYRLMS